MTTDLQPARGRIWDRQDAFGTVLVLIALSLVLEALRGTVPGAGLAAGIVRLLTLTLVLRTVRTPPRSERHDIALVLAGVAVAVPAFFGETERLGLFLSSLATSALVALQIFVIVRRLFQHTVVRMTTAAGALCVYLLIGSFFAGIYGMLASGPDVPLFSNGSDGTSLERIYFSFITLTTTGYGDFTPGTNLGRVTAVIEALMGQLYLVTVVALVIGALTRQGRPRADVAGDSERP